MQKVDSLSKSKKNTIESISKNSTNNSKTLDNKINKTKTTSKSPKVNNPTTNLSEIETKQRLNNIVKILKDNYPQAKCALNFADPLQLLVATILSAQCTDERVNEVTKVLFKKYKTLHDYANANFETLAQEIRSTGFYKNKARNIISCCKQILERFDGKIPQSISELTTLPGIGRKTANVVLGNAFGIAEGIVVDTHVARVSKRLGLTQNINPDKIEEDLMKIVPKEDWIIFAHLLIFHGRNRCKARNPDCDNCEIVKFCPKII